MSTTPFETESDSGFAASSLLFRFTFDPHRPITTRMVYMRAMRDFVSRQAFLPGLVGLLTNPFWIARRSLAEGIRQFAGSLDGRLLDVGCGIKPYRALFNVESHVGLEVERSLQSLGSSDVVYDGSRFPFADSTFDSVFCSQVLEHVFETDTFLSEIARVLKPGGRFLFTVPFVWDEHEEPWDYGRYSTFGLKALLERHGLRVHEQLKLSADLSLVFQLINAYLVRVTNGAPMWVRRVVQIFIIAPTSLIGSIAGRVLPGNPGLYLDQIATGERV